MTLNTTTSPEQMQAAEELTAAMNVAAQSNVTQLPTDMKIVTKKKTKADLAREKKLAETAASMQQIQAKPEWYQNLRFKLGKNRQGVYGPLIDANSMENIVTIINNDPATAHKFALNSFTRKVEIVSPLTLLGKTYQPGPIKNTILGRLIRHLETYEVYIFNQRADDSLIQAAEENEFNPVKDYVTNCKAVYDANPGKYIDTFFQKTLGAEDSEAVKLAAHILLNEMVAKAFDPFAKAEFSIDTIGSQGVGKTRVFEALFSLYNVNDLDKTIEQAQRTTYFLNNVTAIKDKDAQLKMSQNWGFIDDELEATRKSSFEEMKALLSTTFFEIRGAYQRTSEVVPRSAVVVRTTNENDYLKDKSGQRRFLPILSNKEAKTCDISKFKVGELMAMIGEAVAEFEAGFNSNRLKPEQLAMFEKARKDFTYETSIDDAINEYLQIQIPSTWNKWLPQMKQDYIQDTLNGVQATQYTGYRSNALPSQGGALVNFKVEDLVSREYVTTKDVMFEVLREPLSSRNGSKVKYALEHNPLVSNEKRFKINGKTIRGFKLL